MMSPDLPSNRATYGWRNFEAVLPRVRALYRFAMLDDSAGYDELISEPWINDTMNGVFEYFQFSLAGAMIHDLGVMGGKTEPQILDGLMSWRSFLVARSGPGIFEALVHFGLHPDQAKHFEPVSHWDHVNRYMAGVTAAGAYGLQEVAAIRGVPWESEFDAVAAEARRQFKWVYLRRIRAELRSAIRGRS